MKKKPMKRMTGKQAKFAMKAMSPMKMKPMKKKSSKGMKMVPPGFDSDEDAM